MNRYLSEAIRDRRLLRLTDDNEKRLTVEPYVLGYSVTGDDALLCRQVAPAVAGGAHWHLFHLSRISAVQMLPKQFEPLPEGESLPMDAFLTIYAAIEAGEPANRGH